MNGAAWCDTRIGNRGSLVTTGIAQSGRAPWGPVEDGGSSPPTRHLTGRPRYAHPILSRLKSCRRPEGASHE